MFELTGVATLGIAAVLAAGSLALVVALWGRRVLTKRWWGALSRTVLVLLSQVTATALVFLLVNNGYRFYSTWGDLFGVEQPAGQIDVQRLPSGDGRVELLPIKAVSVPGASGQAIVWLPPQYSDPAFAHHKFPVLVFLHGEPSTPDVVFTQYQFAAYASAAVASGKVKPFIAVFPPLKPLPPRDTECTNVPKGPQAETWLTHDVVDSVVARYRTDGPGPRWSLAGWSAGGFCAAKLLLRQPTRFGAAVVFGGYFEPLLDQTTGDLFGGSQVVKDANSPLLLYRRHGLRGDRMLIIVGRQDKLSYSDTVPMIAATKGDQRVTVTVFPEGGHNDRNYRVFVPGALEWLGAGGAFG